MNDPSSCNPFEDGSAIVALRGVPMFEEALARLLHTAEHGRPCGLVRGPSGCGKSLLLEQVDHECRRAGLACGQIDLQRSSADEFPTQLACELGAMPTAGQPVWRQIEDAIVGRALAARPTLLLLDHLDTADATLQQSVERLLSSAESSAGWCTILCAGRSRSPVVAELARRHGELRIELGPLSLDETIDFLQRVSAANGCAAFTDEAAGALHACSGGLVREILSLGRLALFAGSADALPEVTADLLTRVAGETVRGERVHRPLSHPAASGVAGERMLADAGITADS